MAGPVDELKAHHDALLAHLEQEPSLAVSTRAVLSKALLLAGASELEVDVTRIIEDYFSEVTSNNSTATAFVAKAALARRYHSFFQWDGNNINSFFALFGPDFKEYASKLVGKNSDLEKNIRGFLRIGSERNLLVHGNFAAYSLTLTSDEIYRLYTEAAGFRDALPGILRRTEAHEV
ncbi:hypothetical protein I6E81_03240 [Salinibacterium sp. NG22]|uniref:HEPN domain-containing protein n=1 Tax=Salinibacterium sp. NG22 TaxID=2792040 RepID=UPI0018CDE6BF|nr:HEPN domain-containing protein [Salinibacterium sp. NG22]MBH0109175.1 hypothetical protein [Salinibacterium sp. NG22]